MIPELGHYALILAFCVSLVQGILPLIGAHRQHSGWIALARPAAWALNVMLMFAFTCLTVAFIQPADPHADSAALEAELTALCLDKLTRYKVPDEWRFVDQFPRNAMGKVVKPKLRELVTAPLEAH